MEPVKLVQMSIYHSNVYRKDFSWLHFEDEPRVQVKQQKKCQQSCISLFVAYPTMPVANRSTSPDITTVFYGEGNNRRNKGSNFLGSSFSNKDNKRAAIQFGRENQPKPLKP